VSVHSIKSGGESTSPQLCTLAYAKDALEKEHLVKDQVLLIAVFDGNDSLSLFVNPAWRQVVSPNHLDYTMALFVDLVQRSHSYPEDLFQQLSSIHVGPLVALEVRSIGSSEVPSAIPATFVQLKDGI
jgi:hypothetical protein